MCRQFYEYQFTLARAALFYWFPDVIFMINQKLMPLNRWKCWAIFCILIARIVGRRSLNETTLLALLIWFLILLLIIVILLFYICSLPALRPRGKAQAPPVVEVQPPIVEYYHHQMPGTVDIPGFKAVPIGPSKMIKAYWILKELTYEYSVFAF